MRTSTALLTLAATAFSGLIATPSSAQEQPSPADPPSRPAPTATARRPDDSRPAEPAWQRAPRERRSGFTAGISLGFGLGQAAGYPNDSKKIGREAYYTETGIGTGGTMTVWIGGALVDWLTFGFGITGGGYTADDLAAGGAAFVFRTEAFPLWSLGGPWREIGLALDTGTGAATITPPDDADTKLADGGAVSRIGLGAFYEGIRLWKVSMGPFASGSYSFSETLRLGEFAAGWRTAIYTGP